MAFFQFRRSREEQAAKLAPTQTVEAMRRRAMHRLIGAAVLVLAGVIGFPLVFDNQPRPIPVDLPIEIADRSKVKPLVVPPPAPAVASAASGIVVRQAADPEPATPVASPAPVVPSLATPATAELPAVPAAVPPTPVAAKIAAPPIEKPVTEKSVAKASDASKAQALLEGKSVAGATVSEGRFVVQVGAFADADKVREVRQKVERVGLKTYTQVVETKDGSRTRIRVGPFSDKAQATQVAEKIRKLAISAVILTL
jgi:DedD protein